MTPIRVSPPVLQGEAGAVSEASAELRSAAEQALSAANHLYDPIARAQLAGRVSGLAGDGNREAQNLVSLLGTMGTTLSTRAVAFLAADGASASGMLGAFQSLVGMTNSFVDFFRALAHLPQDALGSILSLGGILGLGSLSSEFITLLVPGAQGIPTLGACFKGLTFSNLTRPDWWPEWLWPFGSGRQQEPISEEEQQPRVEQEQDTSEETKSDGPPSTSPQWPPAPELKDVDPAAYTSCAAYAQDRRPDLGSTGGADGGAYNYIEKYKNTEHYYRLPGNFAETGGLESTPLRPGTAVVWDKGVHGAHATLGHVAIIEVVGPDYIEVSEANWGTGSRTIKAEILPDLHYIL